jgi:hypothetical protein
MNRHLLLAATLFLCTHGASAQSRLLPVDQAASVPDFFSFRAQLQAAIARRDSAHVLGALSKDVKLSFGGDIGIEDFKNIWKPASPDSRLWDVLASTLALGGTFAADGTFTAPYVFTNWPKDKDAFTHMVAVGSGIRIRSAPTVTAEPIGSLDFSVVQLAEQPPVDAKWGQVKLTAGRTGFVDVRFLRSPIDYRINFAKLDGRWQVVFFLAGD